MAMPSGVLAQMLAHGVYASNCTFRANHARLAGGALSATDASPVALYDAGRTPESLTPAEQEFLQVRLTQQVHGGGGMCGRVFVCCAYGAPVRRGVGVGLSVFWASMHGNVLVCTGR